jgi:hypothetical protein
MKKILGTIASAALLLAGIAAANAAGATPTPPANAAPVINNSKDMAAADQLHHMNIRQDLRDRLTKAGYTDVKIMPSSFFVRAKDEQGNPVEMAIGPDSFTEVLDVTPPKSAKATQNSSTASANDQQNKSVVK